MSIQVFYDKVVHGLSIQSERDKIEEAKMKEEDRKDEGKSSICLAVWGGTCLALLTKTRLDFILDTQVGCITDTAIIIPDWILDVSISPYEPATCALVTAHNELFRAKLVAKQERANDQSVKLEALSSPINPILYSANLIWDSSSIILVASGTVFGDIITWKFSLADGKNQLISRFKGHEGSVFGVDISPTVIQSGGGQTGRLLASCSDDRTIRIWNLDAPGCETQSSAAGCPLPEECTGFGSSGNNATVPNGKGQVTVAMGHASRIWRVRFLCSEQDIKGARLIDIISFGEDATAQQWNFRVPLHISGHASRMNSFFGFPPALYSTELIHGKTYAFHSGKHLWSSDLGLFGGNYCLGTGGADGKISFYQVELMGKHVSPGEKEKIGRENTTHTIRFDDLSCVLQLLNPCEIIGFPTKPQGTSAVMKGKKDGMAPKDSFGRYAFVSENEALVTTALGRVYCGYVDELPVWKEVHLPDSAHQHLRPCVAIKSFTEHGIGYLAGAHGKIYAYSCNSRTMQLIGSVAGKAADMFGLCNKNRQTYALMVTGLHKRLATILHLEHALLGTSKSTLIDLPEKFVATSAEMASDLLVCGSRSGLLAVYRPQKSRLPLEVFDGINSGKEDAITAIISLQPALGPIGQPQYFVAASRNGTYSIFSVVLCPELNAGLTSLIQISHQTRASFGLAIENVWLQDQDLLFYGFQGKSFVVWNETKQCEVMKVECGGAHRSYAFVPLMESGGGCYVCTKASKLIFSTCKTPSHRVVKKGSHGREIKACAISQDCTLVATGAEDTLIRIWSQKADETQKYPLQPVAVIRKHTTGIQHLQWIGSRYLLSSGGNEEFFIWAVHTVPSFGIGLVCEASYPGQSLETGLRITCFDATDLSNLGLMETGVLITLGFSDSSFCSYLYSLRPGFTSLARGRYTSSCITQIRNLVVTNSYLCIITAATDGNLAAWSANVTRAQGTMRSSAIEFQLLSARKLHQSTVKCLDVHKSRADKLIVATGGDDGALGISIYPADKFFIQVQNQKSHRCQPHMFFLPAAHAAAVTGLSFFARDLSVCPSSLELVTVSNDQKLKLWKIEIPAEICDRHNPGTSLAVKPQNCSFTSVADTAGLAVLKNHGDRSHRTFRVLVIGNGMEIFGLELK